MRKFRKLTTLLGLMLVFAAYFPSARADEWDKTTKVTFKEPVQVAGKVLQPGTYIFKLLDSSSNQHVVQIFNEDHSQLITTVLAIPNERLEPAGKTILTYDERPADQPMALAVFATSDEPPKDSSSKQSVFALNKITATKPTDHRIWRLMRED